MSPVFSQLRFLSRPASLWRGLLALLPVFLMFISWSALADAGGVVNTGGALSSGSSGGPISLGMAFCTVFNNTTPLGPLFGYFSAAAGVYFAIRGMTTLNGRAENPSQNPLHKALAYLGAAICLFTLPGFEGMLVQTFFSLPDAPGGVTAACSPTAPTTAPGTAGLDVMMTNLINDIKPTLMSLLAVTSEAMGLYLIVRGLMKAANHGTDAKANSLTNIYTSLVIGAILCAIGPSINAFLASIFGASGYTPSSAVNGWAIFTSPSNGLSQGAQLTQFQNAIKAALTFFQLIGIISFIRGWTIVRQAVEGHQQSTMSQGFTHIIGGTIAINIYGFLPLLNKTFGMNFI